jgi:hypothetical protein
MTEFELELKAVTTATALLETAARRTLLILFTRALRMQTCYQSALRIVAMDLLIPQKVATMRTLIRMMAVMSAQLRPAGRALVTGAMSSLEMAFGLLIGSSAMMEMTMTTTAALQKAS